MKSKPKKVMEESLKAAAKIRRGLEGRRHSDSTGEAWSDFDEILRACTFIIAGLEGNAS
jgi:hypothetical protein